MEHIQIRRVLSTELEQLQAISIETFTETFGAANTQENMQKYLQENFGTEKLANELADPDSEFYFAVLDNSVIGYLKINFGQAQTELKDGRAVEIERIYVVKKFHGRQAGQQLCEKAVEAAKAADAQYIWLGVWEENIKAIGFYKNNGFEEFGKHSFWLGDDEQTDIMMKLMLGEQSVTPNA